MAILEFMGFDHIANTGLDFFGAGAYPKWTVANSGNWGTVAGLLGGLAFTSFGTNELLWTSGSTYSTLIVGGRFKVINAVISVDRPFLVFTDGVGIQCGVNMNTTGHLYLWRGTSSTVLATGATALVQNSWYFVELKIEFSGSAYYELRLGGVTEFSGIADTTNTANSYATTVGFSGNTASGGFTVMDDLYIADTSGSSPSNDFLGVIRVETVFVSSNNSVQWTPLSSTNASNVDETQVDGDTTYNSSSTSGHVDTFNHGALSSSPTTIFGVAVLTKHRKDDVAARSIRNKFISGGTTVNGATVTVNTTYAWTKDYYALDPDTSAAWANSTAVNNTKIGYEHI